MADISKVKLPNGDIYNLKTLYIENKENSSSIVAIDDGADGWPMKSLVIGVEPVQAGSGDPSPTNIRPITGHTSARVTRCGKNLFGGTVNQYNINNILTTGTSLKAGTYKVSVNWSGTLDSLYIRPQENVTSTSYVQAYNTNTVTLTLANDATVYVQGLKNTGISASGATVQIELGSTATSYEPYVGQTYDITFPTEAGTVYGGTLDVTTGVLTVDRAMVVYDGSDDESWNYYSVAQGNLFRTSVIVMKPTSTGNAVNALSNRFKAVPQDQRADGSISGGTNTRNVDFISSTAGTVAAWRTWLLENPVELCITLETPITYQLTPTDVETLLGTNNIWADTGDILKIEYIRNIASDIQYIVENSNAATVNNHTVQTDVPANAVFTDTTYIPASATPLMDGTAAVGTSVKYARQDHVHPTDNRINTKIIASKTQPINQQTGDIWLVLSEGFSYAEGVSF